MFKASNWKRYFALSVGFVCVLSLVRCATAAGVILQTGFESPFVPGSALNGQQGWKRADLGTGSSTAIVENAIGTSGSPAVRLTRGPNSDTRWGLISQPFPSQRFVIVDWDMKVTQSTGTAGFGPFLGMDCYDRNPSPPRVLGSLGVDATTGDVLAQLQDTGYLVDTGVVVAFDQFNHFRIVFDFLNDTYTGLVNGATVSSTGFVDRQFGLNDFTDADITAFAAAGDGNSQANTASAVFDNYLVRDGLLGDYDIDGDVDQGDYGRWRATFGTTVSVPGNQADGNRNGVIDAADYPVWRDNLGASIFGSPGVGSFVVSIIPEPASFMLGLLGGSALLMSPWRRIRAMGR